MCAIAIEFLGIMIVGPPYRIRNSLEILLWISGVDFILLIYIVWLLYSNKKSEDPYQEHSKAGMVENKAVANKM